MYNRNGLRIIVCGGRDFDDYVKLESALNKIHEDTPISYLFHGNSRGAGTLADERGKVNVYKTFAVPAQWQKFGKSAGVRRNQSMLNHNIDLVVAFPGGAGTRGMVSRARKAGIKVIEIT